MAKGNLGDGEAAQKKNPVGRRRVYDVEGAPPRPVPVSWHLSASAHALVREIQDATGERPAVIASQAIEFYYRAKYSNGVPQKPGTKA